MKISYCSMIITGVVLGFTFFSTPPVSAHTVSGFSIQPDPNYVDPVTHFQLTKENHPHIILQRDSEFTLPMILKSDGNGTGMTSYLFHITDGNDFTAETMPTGMLIYVVPNHLLVPNGFNQTFNIVIKVGKNTLSGIYAPNLVIKWNDNNITKFMDVDPIYFQVGQWNWDSLSRQLERGVAANDVKCKEGLQLIIKSEDGSPACVKPETAIVLVEHRWATNVPQPNPMIGLNDDTGIATLGNYAYYFETPNYTETAYVHPTQISFHDVTFTLFPSGFRGGLPAWGCGGGYYWADAKFLDGTNELLQIFVGSKDCFLPQPSTHFSNHTNPQAGLTFYNGKMKLLVSVEDRLQQNCFSGGSWKFNHCSLMMKTHLFYVSHSVCV